MAYEVTVFPFPQAVNGRSFPVPKLPPVAHFPAIALGTEQLLAGASGDCLICINLSEDVRLKVGASGVAPGASDMVLKVAASPHWFQIDATRTPAVKAIAA